MFFAVVVVQDFVTSFPRRHGFSTIPRNFFLPVHVRMWVVVVGGR